jgi:hypothetical protein
MLQPVSTGVSQCRGAHQLSGASAESPDGLNPIATCGKESTIQGDVRRCTQLDPVQRPGSDPILKRSRSFAAPKPEKTLPRTSLLGRRHAGTSNVVPDAVSVEFLDA